MAVRILLAGIAGAITSFLMGFLLYGLLLRGYFESTMNDLAKSVMNTEPSFPPLVAAQLVFGLLFAFIFDYWASIATFARGAIGGAILWFGLSLGFNLQMSAFFKDMHVGSPYAPFIADLIAATLMGAVTGGVIGLVLGLMKKRAG